jgi:hypothetical protein
MTVSEQIELFSFSFSVTVTVMRASDLPCPAGLQPTVSGERHTL